MYLTALRFTLIISAYACNFLCDLKKSEIAAVEDTVDKQ